MANNDIVPGFDDEKDDSLKIRLEKVQETSNCIILSLTGYIDTYNSNFFQKRIQKAIDCGFVKLIFQCGSLNYVSSTGIGSFTAFLKAVKPRGGDLIILDVQPKVLEVFHLLGFSQFFIIKDNIDDSINYFKIDRVQHKPVLFPKVVPCPICYKKLKALKPGRFRCSECKNILAIDDTGQVLLG
ncbi:MAG: STAS domain-containing protein [Treponema sp.]|jgi:anti-anti-sigma factor|nr:STAS domain-containing protein [Treponema sp.]